MQIIFQDPFSSLNFRRTIGQSIEEPLVVHKNPWAGKKDNCFELLEEVGLRPNISIDIHTSFPGAKFNGLE